MLNSKHFSPDALASVAKEVIDNHRSGKAAALDFVIAAYLAQAYEVEGSNKEIISGLTSKIVAAGLSGCWFKFNGEPQDLPLISSTQEAETWLSDAIYSAVYPKDNEEERLLVVEFDPIDDGGSRHAVVLARQGGIIDAYMFSHWPPDLGGFNPCVVRADMNKRKFMFTTSATLCPHTSEQERADVPEDSKLVTWMLELSTLIFMNRALDRDAQITLPNLRRVPVMSALGSTALHMMGVPVGA